MDFSAAINAIKDANLYRSLRTLSSPQGRETRIDGRRVLLFSSNSYLGLSEEPAIVESAIRALKTYGTGAGGSRLVTGNMTPHMELEAELAAFKGTEACLVFSSGYVANLGVISSVAGKDSVVFSDELNHASIIDGCRLAKGRTVVYRHNDVDDLVAKIRENGPSQGLIVTDSVFSMDGDIARLPDLVRAKKEFGLLLMVDDAHATGVLGKTGRGSAEHFGLAPADVDILMGTLSKAIPAEGGFICGTAALCDYLKNTARSFIYTTALAPSTVAAARAGVAYVREHPERVRRLRDNAAYFAERLSQLGMAAGGQTPIIPVIIGGEAEAARVSEQLLERGIFVPCIRYPTVAKGRARLRFTIMATHTRADMDFAVDTLGAVLGCRPGLSCDCHRSLPDIRQQAVFHFLHVLFVAGQFGFEHGVLQIRSGGDECDDTGRDAGSNKPGTAWKNITAAAVAHIPARAWGLFIVKSILDAHGAEMTLQSREGQSTRIRIVFMTRA